MTFTNYYKLERVALKAKTRLDCTYSTHDYLGFEKRAATKATKATANRDATNVGDIVAYYNDVPPHFGNNPKRKAGKCLTIKGENISSIYVPDPTKNIGYGDFKDTTDALLFVFHNFNVVNGVIQQGSIIEVFVAIGASKDRVPLLNLLSNGDLESELNELRKKASTTEINTATV